MLCDTDFLIAILRKEPKAIQKLNSLVKAKDKLFITHVNLWELYQGAFLSIRRDRNLVLCEELVKFFEVLPFTQEVDRRFGKLTAHLKKEGTPIGVMDTLIASIAQEYDQIVLSRNEKHFKKARIEVLTW